MTGHPTSGPVRRHALLMACAAACLALLALPASARAADCDTFKVTDGMGFLWDFDDNDAAADDGSGDAFDTFGELEVNGTTFAPDSLTSCGPDENAREFVWGADTDASFPGLEVTRKVFVPETGPGFARWLDIISNPTGADVMVDVKFVGNLGSDSDTVVRTSADGNATADAGEPWVATDDGTGFDPALGHVADGSLGGPGVANGGWGLVTGSDDVTIAYDDLVVPAGGRVILLHFEVQRVKRADAAAAAEALAGGLAEGFAQLSADERADIVNFNATDPDGDGVGFASDNCPGVPNADQADTDGDGKGDVCDEDIDGDGLSNELETAIGTDPAKADTDGDGVGDADDRCPRTPGNLADGCTAEDAPPTVAFTAPANGTTVDPGTGTTLAATAADDRGVANVVFVDDGAVIATDTTAPYSTEYRPRGEDVGRNTLAAFAVDTAGQVAVAFLLVETERFELDGISSRTTPGRDRSAPYRFTTRGEIDLPDGVTPALGCRGKVAVNIKAGKRTVSSRRRKVRDDCSFRSRVRFTLPGRLAGRLKVITRFRGNAVLKPERARTRRVRVG